MNLSRSSHPHKHVSIVKTYIWIELCNFLRVDDPGRFSNLGVSDASIQPHMFSLATYLDADSWQLTGASSRAIALDLQELDILAGIYQENSVRLGLSSFDVDIYQVKERSALQVRGKLWSGRRYFQAYFFAGTEDLKMFSSGSCVVSFLSSNGEKCYGIIRDIWRHTPYKHPKCPDVNIFQIERLLVTFPPPVDKFDFNSDLLPLPVAVLSKQYSWVCHLQLCSDVLCLQPFDNNPKMFYMLDLLS
jgi:hypothetical protein